MNKFISAILAISLFSNFAFAECDFKTGISTNEDGSYRYSKECHIKVGAMKQEGEDLRKAITLKDLTITTADQRTQLWMDSSFKLEDRLEKVQSLEKSNETLYFVLGALTVIATGFVVSNLTDRR